MQLNHMSSPVALCSLSTKVALTFQQDKHRLSLQAFINHLDIYLPSSVTILFYSKLTVFYNYKKIYKTQRISVASKTVVFFFDSLHFVSSPSFSVGNRALLQKLRVAPLAMCEVGFYSVAGGDLFTNLWGPEMKPHTV